MQPGEVTYWSKEIATMLGIAESTLRKWCLRLEAAGYRFLKGDQDRRAFRDQDLIMFRIFHDLTQEKNIPLDIAARLIIERFGEGMSHDTGDTDRDTLQVVSSERSEISPVLKHLDDPLLQSLLTMLNGSLDDRFEVHREQMEELIAQKFEGFKQVITTMQQQAAAALPKPLDPLEEKSRRVTDLITQRRVVAQLETEALALWEQRPESERYIRVGFFRKEEDQNKKDRFVKKYVDEHFEERIKKEYGLDN